MKGHSICVYLLNGNAPHNNPLRERLMVLAQELERLTMDLPAWVTYSFTSIYFDISCSYTIIKLCK